MLVPWLIACLAPGAGSEDVLDPDLETPVITSFSWGCDVEDNAWSLQVVASAWTGGGDLWLTTDGLYVEKHRVRSRQVAPDGTRDELGVDLSIAADWRDVSLGSSTVFRCADVPSLRFVLDAPSGAVVDCRNEGNAVWPEDAPLCDSPIGDTGG